MRSFFVCTRSFRSVMIVASFIVALSACGGGGGTSRPSGPVVSLLPLALPAAHGLAAGEITVAAGQSEEHGDVVVSCPLGGEACVLVAMAGRHGVLPRNWRYARGTNTLDAGSWADPQ